MTREGPKEGGEGGGGVETHALLIIKFCENFVGEKLPIVPQDVPQTLKQNILTALRLI